MVRIGVIGPGAIAKNLHLPSIDAHPEAEVIALCGRNQDNAIAVAEKYGISQVYADYREMLKKERLDAVLVLTPDHCHYAMTMDSLDAGCHVLCEKPLAMTVAEAEKMLESATKKNLIHMTFLNQRELPHFAYGKKILDEGAIGQPFYFSFRFAEAFALKNNRPSWHRDARACAGELGNRGSHVIDMLQWYFGAIERLTASLSTYSPPEIKDDPEFRAANDSALLHLICKNGAHGTIYVGSVSASKPGGKHYRIEGERGVIEIDQSYFEPISQVRLGKLGEEMERLPVPKEFCGGKSEPQSLADYMQFLTTQSVGTRTFIDAILDNRQVTPSFADGLAVQRVMEAALTASETNRWVTVPPSN
jgi:UDP-N-acetylglucosamine 3-dehydrogenase